MWTTEEAGKERKIEDQEGGNEGERVKNKTERKKANTTKKDGQVRGKRRQDRVGEM